MVPAFVHGDASSWIRDEDAADQIFRLVAELVRHVVFGLYNVAKQNANVALLPIVVRCSASEHDIQDDTTAPNIGLFPVIGLRADNFWSSIVRASAWRAEHLSIGLQGGHPEVNQLDSHL